ncbi:hypothetical protein [Mongoliimonas terrestris]|uniref:hypothetical protein n=1 Tax=Mongoliimonas terrestris TaxID=1709001 RepID=UPI0009496FDF|nr:hypothetical protein [Mongoliimonas terrestris]
MIESALVFTLGALSAGLLALLVFPAFTRRAARLARRDAEARLPRSLNEIAAAKDGVRAVFAARTARVEVENAYLGDRLTEERMARAEDGLQLSAARAEVQSLAEALREMEERLTATRDRLLDRDEAIARLTVERRDLERRFAALAERARAAEIQSLEAEEALFALRDQLGARSYGPGSKTATASRPKPRDDDDLVTDVDYVEVDPAPEPAPAPDPFPSLARRAPQAMDTPVSLAGLRSPFAASVPPPVAAPTPPIAMPAPAEPLPADDAPAVQEPLVEASADSLTLSHPTRMDVVLEDGIAPDRNDGSGQSPAAAFPAATSPLDIGAAAPQADWSGRIDEIADRIRRFRAAVGQGRPPAERHDRASEPTAPADVRQDA